LRDEILHHGGRHTPGEDPTPVICEGAMDSKKRHCSQVMHQRLTFAAFHVGVEFLGPGVPCYLDARVANLLRQHRPLLCPCLNEAAKGRRCRRWFRRRCRVERASDHIHLGEIAGRIALIRRQADVFFV
jgi:hypothetical protein